MHWEKDGIRLRSLGFVDSLIEVDGEGGAKGSDTTECFWGQLGPAVAGR